MIIGITGTRFKPTKKQSVSLVELLKEYLPVEFHHGCCKGVDTIASKIVKKLNENTVIVGHPPDINRNVGNYVSTYNKPELEYMARNKNIVKSSDIVIALPRTEYEEVRSGTWYTIRYARSKNKKLIVVNPDGKLVKENL